MERLSELLGVPVDEAETTLAAMVSTTDEKETRLFAKIDRPAGIVSFVKPKAVDEILNDWSYDIGRLVGLVEDTQHLIDKETMLYKLKK